MMTQIVISLTEYQIHSLTEIARVFTQSRAGVIREAVNNYIHGFYYRGQTKGRIAKKILPEGFSLDSCEKLKKGECHIFQLNLD